jgi:tetratricopeptide (TPR) repeat protein
MSEQLTTRNEELISELISKGEGHLAQDDFADAIRNLDRALFLAVTADADTIRIAEMLQKATTGLQKRTRNIRMAALLDSAETRFRSADYLGTHYFAGLALELSPESNEAARWLHRADSAITRHSINEDLVQERLVEIDSLLSYGKVDNALAVIRALVEFAPDNPTVLAAQRRALFELQRSQALAAQSRGYNQRALVALDSALTLYPNHQGCLDLRTQITAVVQRAAVPLDTAQDAAVLSPEMQKQAESAYKDGQTAFRSGNIGEAMEHWEVVERVAPGYQSVRSYLIKAYRLSGLELYGENRLADAVTVWRKAVGIDPDNEEIRSYIERTETEISRLQELSYDHP